MDLNDSGHDMKRALDLVGSFLGLAISWPIMAVAMLAIRLESAGPALFRQARVGRKGHVFVCYKLRTMQRDTKQVPTHEVAASSVTKVGAILRATKLDELPQLYNVLRGDMSLVGPRPSLPSQTELIEARTRQGALEVPPGITGLAQVRGITMAHTQRLAAIDGLYARTRTTCGDLRIILQTFTGSGLRA
jgi:O-antigen biosynthesis protein WbqP